MTATIEPPRRRRPSMVVTILLLLVAIPTVLFTACGATLFVVNVTSGADGMMLLAVLGLSCAAAGVGGLYAIYRVFRGD